MPSLWYVGGIVIDSKPLDYRSDQESNRGDSCLPATDGDPALNPADKGSCLGRSVLGGPMILCTSNGRAKISVRTQCSEKAFIGTNIEAISASDAAITTVPSAETMKP